MKDILVLSADKNWKAELALVLARLSKERPIKWTYVSNRTDIISELSMRYYDAVVLHSNLPISHLEIIFKYLSSTDYKNSPLFFVSDHFENFKTLLDSQNFSRLFLLADPIEPELIATTILSTLYPVNAKGPGDSNVKINLEFLKVFIDATKYILESFCQFKNVQHGRPYLYDESNPPELAIEGQIELRSSFFDGQFIIGLTKKAYLEVLRLVLAQEFTEITPENEDFAGELVNMVYGQAKTVLNTTGHNFEKVIPTFTRNPSVHSTKNPIVVVPLNTDAGVIELMVEIRKIKT